MKVLLVYPEYPDTFWSFKHALKVVFKKAAHPPLGLLTVAAMLPTEWDKKLIDMNTQALKDKDIKWADYVFISAMVVQRESVTATITRCKALGKKVVAGGPLFTTEYEEFGEVDHLVLDEAEITLPRFLKDIEAGTAKRIYTSKERPDITKTPIPAWSLIKMGKYTTMNIQYSRGCPYDCEFCDIVTLNGHTPRTKTTKQVINELEALQDAGWHGSVFIVDDNFIGNKRKLKEEILPALIKWRKTKKFAPSLFTEASINLADDDELMRLMVEAGFDRVFIGIETPNEESLIECNKLHNKNRDLVAAVKSIQAQGMEVQGGFIVGFDSDPASIFQRQIEFIQKSGIVTAMVGLLNAPRGSRLYERLKKENRLLKKGTGDNTDCSINFVPKMHLDTLINGYKQIMNTIYAPKYFYERIKTFLKEFKPRHYEVKFYQVRFYHIVGLVRSFWILGVVDKGRKYFWRFILPILFKRPKFFPLSLILSVYGLHFRKVCEKLSRTTTPLGTQKVPSTKSA
ncbi:MAG: B12-binding domain-containing radical SAM protein [Dehalococcoidales bacterium]|nr:B12-binding domain-containing radical SAM protein [Dehalococcoidales bacterium]